MKGTFMKYTSRPISRSFTLTELLTAIGIISILAALLLLGLRNAMESKRRTRCVNNLRQITLATIVYTDDNQGHFPTIGATTILLPASIRTCPPLAGCFPSRNVA